MGNTKLDAGTLYDANKQLVLKTEHPLSHLELSKKQELLEDFFADKVIEFAMMLCHERRDYTVFQVGTGSTAEFNAAAEVVLCCINRGEIYSMDPTEDGQAYEIWLKIDDEAFCYYLFPYDKAVIKCK